MHIFRRAALCAVFFAAYSTHASGAILTFAFTGHITKVNFSNPARGFVVGASVAGRFSYDDTMQLTAVEAGDYQALLPTSYGLQMTLNGIPQGVPDLSLFQLWNDYPLLSDTIDGLHVFSFLESDLSTAGRLFFDDRSHAFFPPGAPPPLSSINPADFVEQLLLRGQVGVYTYGGVSHRIEGVIDSIHLVPEPSTFALGLLAAAGLVVGLRCRRR